MYCIISTGVGKAIGKRNAVIRYVTFFPLLLVTTAASSAPYLVPVNATIPFRKIQALLSSQRLVLKIFVFNII